MNESIFNSLNEPWDVLPEAVGRITARVRALLAGEDVRRPQDARARPKPVNGNITVLPVHGFIEARGESSIFGDTSIEEFGGWLDAALVDKQVGAIVLDIDSPGGLSMAGNAISNMIFAARGKKPIFAVANPMAASAALNIGSAADQLWVTPGGDVGSIGSLIPHVDMSKMLDDAGLKVTLVHSGKFKIEGNPFEPLGDEARAEFQRLVDVAHAEFVSNLSRNRGKPQKTIRESWGQGRMLDPEDALAVGMVDKIALMQELFASLGVRGGGGGTRADADPHYSVDLRRRRMKMATGFNTTDFSLDNTL